jgi:hypothetical protein
VTISHKTVTIATHTHAHIENTFTHYNTLAAQRRQSFTANQQKTIMLKDEEDPDEALRHALAQQPSGKCACVCLCVCVYEHENIQKMCHASGAIRV